MSRSWPPSREQLQDWRSVGDEPADMVVAEVFAHHGHDGVHQMLKAILDTEAWQPQGMVGAKLQYYLDTIARRTAEFDVAAHDAEVEAGQDVFAEHGPEVILILGTYSLPAAYAAYFGAKVLLQTGYLTNMPNRRLIETAQIIVDVMQHGGLHPGGIGRTSAEKTRLMHAAIRHLILHKHTLTGDDDHEWNTAEWGVPINQEDMAATLMTFAYIVMDGLDRMNVKLTDVEKQSYLDSWREVGAIMGVVPELIPDTFDEAESLTRAIQDHQVLDAPPSDPRWAGGVALTEALLPVLNDKMLPGVPASLMRLFLPAEVCDGLGIPRRRVADWAMKRVVRFFGWLDTHVLSRLLRKSRPLRRFSMRLLNGVLEVERGGDREPFRLPDSLDWYETRSPLSHRLVDLAGR